MIALMRMIKTIKTSSAGSRSWNFNSGQLKQGYRPDVECGIVLLGLLLLKLRHDLRGSRFLHVLNDSFDVNDQNILCWASVLELRLWAT
ncbi:Eukaryotic translation initiation factor 2-alpha kinase 3 [Frankliniella fusca]|uniref:Eukaryotic translation initiation factor 2-alpha kinase 3 n=1 Tax=Frankliniella fusca TaxID=407009 RepID=A0AAE1L4K2_9NEOP|nr:Eukaryotic translation initiation factor 2-alpha kinase 3 [Frankliniella fusca]